MLPRLARFVEDTVIVGHNIAFDLRFFARKEEEVGVRFTNPLLDTFFLEGIVHPKQADRRLDAIAARLGINVTGRHTALGDALITAVFVALIPGLAEHGIVTLKQAADACAADLESVLGLELKRARQAGRAQTRQLCRRCAPRKRRAGWAFLVIFNRNARRAFALRFRNVVAV